MKMRLAKVRHAQLRKLTMSALPSDCYMEQLNLIEGFARATVGLKINFPLRVVITIRKN